eukprot:2825829-Amphidinium_carterae.2
MARFCGLKAIECGPNAIYDECLDTFGNLGRAETSLIISRARLLLSSSSRFVAMGKRGNTVE